MPSTLVVVAHPDLARSRISSAWITALRDDGRATVHVLTEILQQPGFDVEREKELLVAHTRIILLFPFHWYSAPAILHSWLDLVLVHGWAYGPEATALAGKELALAVSTWSTESDYSASGRYGYSMRELTAPYEVTAKRIAMVYLPAHILNGVGRVTDEELRTNASALVIWANTDPAKSP
ncbi:NAD(P)H-dependent oxidoreductase [Mycetocola saprophilus]|uniref:NAD(P)H-dependent oxidoreductase n=1 Tax=Mycetocola saprophilus TaxID=76636 RepID=UPI0004BEC9CD|nr:NAD(P)H-dependent oxidoreductase [Mycetocola saprophilus]